MMILKRYVFFEVMRTFLLTLLAMTVIVVFVTSFQAVRKWGPVDPLLLLELVPFLVAGAFSLTVPISFLVAVTLTLGRLSQEREITAMRSSGVHLHTVLSPLLVSAFVLGAVTFVLFDQVVPSVYKKKRELANRAIQAILSSKLGAGASTIDDFPGYRIAYRRIEGGVIKDLVVHQLDSSGMNISMEYLASQARVEFDQESESIRFVLDRGSITRIHPDHREADEWKPTFQKQRMGIRVPIEQGKRSYPRHRQLSVVELASMCQDVAAMKDRLNQSLNTLDRKDQEAAALPEDLGASVRRHERKVLEAALEREKKMWRYYATAFHSRFAMPLATMLVVMIGAPLGILIRHANKLLAFAASAVPVLLVYYPALLIGEEMGRKGVLEPWIGAWSSTLVVGGLGIGLLLNLYRR